MKVDRQRRITFLLTSKQYKKLEKYCKTKELTMSEVIRDLLKDIVS